MIADCFLETRDYRCCQVEVKKECGRDLSLGTIRKWLKKADVQEYLTERFEDIGFFNSWTKERWFGLMSRHILGERVMKGPDLYCMKLIGQFKGWGSEGLSQQTNVQINFTQKDGRE